MDNLILDELRKPFHPSQVSWKPGAVKGERALALAYADLRAYMNRLDEVCGTEWAVAYEPWGEDRIICRLTIMDVTRSSTGESDKEAERSEIGGTVAEAMSFKRAAAMFGLGRYLYNLPTGWADYDPGNKRFTDKAKAKLTGILVQQYRRANDGKGEVADLFVPKPDEDGEGEPSAKQPVKIGLKSWTPLALLIMEPKWPANVAKWALWASSERTSDAKELSTDEVEDAIASIRGRIEQRAGVPSGK